jgi:hypothetical protein
MKNELSMFHNSFKLNQNGQRSLVGRHLSKCSGVKSHKKKKKKREIEKIEKEDGKKDINLDNKNPFVQPD